jgi:hypothetical protein
MQLGEDVMDQPPEQGTGGMTHLVDPNIRLYTSAHPRRIRARSGAPALLQHFAQPLGTNLFLQALEEVSPAIPVHGLSQLVVSWPGCPPSDS